MKTPDVFTFSIVTPQEARARVAGLLDRAFKVSAYQDHFPHIFLPTSSARIVLALNGKNEVIGTCAIDTELWPEPRMAQGACVGSVAVDPHVQGRGVGRQMLRWTLDQLSLQAQHDFVYLFSDRPAFYESLGFCLAGTETLNILDASKIGPSAPSLGMELMKPVPAASLDCEQRLSLWSALEAGRHRGESCSSWLKFNAVFEIPDLLVTSLHDSSGRWHAGAFIGKGIDFQGVMHTFFARSESVLVEFLSRFAAEFRQAAAQLLLATGVWSPSLGSLLQERERRPLFMIRGLRQSTAEVISEVESQYLYPRALFSS
ncbi:MAG: Acetyltransferase domain [Pseudomonadota bacterium]